MSITLGREIIGYGSPVSVDIAAGVLSLSQFYTRVGAQSGTSDDLDTINNGVALVSPPYLFVLQAASGDTITLKHNTGNLQLSSGQDIVLASLESILLIHDGTNVRDFVHSVGAIDFSELGNVVHTHLDNDNGGTLSAAAIASGTLDDARLSANVVTLTGTQTLTNKTLTAPTIADFTNMGHDHLDADDGGTLSAAAIASGTLDNARINWAAPSAIGSGTPAAGTFTTLTLSENSALTRAANGAATFTITNNIALGNASASAQLVVLSQDSGGFFGAFPSDAATAAWQDRVVFGANSTAAGFALWAANASQDMRFYAGSSTEVFRLTSTGGVFNETGADQDFRVEGDTDQNLIFGDASVDRVGIGTNTPVSGTKLQVSYTTTATASVQMPLVLTHDSSNTPTAGYGTGIEMRGKSSTQNGRQMGQVTFDWQTETDASRKSRVTLNTFDTSTAKLILQGYYNGTRTKIGLGGAPGGTVHAVDIVESFRVVYNGAGGPYFDIYETGSGNSRYLRIQTDLTNSLCIIDSDTAAGGTPYPLLIRFDGTERMRFDSTGIALNGVATGVAQSTGWSVTNVTTDKTFDANATTLDELADVVGTLITYLISRGDLAA